MLSQFLGMLLLLGTAGGVALALAVALWGFLREHRVASRRALLAGSGIVAVYGLFWLLGLALAPRVVLPPGQAIAFCGLDCHLHVSVQQVQRGAELGVTVKFASNARRAPEFPAMRRFRLRDSTGQEYAPSNRVPETALPAGASWEYELRFPSPAGAAGAVLIVTWGGGIDYLVPGAGNPLVQRQQRLALPQPAGA
ncbi:MAG TPA: hypothetical protein VFU23_16195 [Gemmatimonadales bacterium]|nr:hypothetical protein [Gemmatimonadales bacterium]